MRRHVDFSQSEFWFLDEKHEAKKIYRKEQMAEQGIDLEESATTVQTKFSYLFPTDLKLPEVAHNQEELEADFERSIGGANIEVPDTLELIDNAIEDKKIEQLRKQELLSNEPLSQTSYMQLKLLEKDKKIQ